MLVLTEVEWEGKKRGRAQGTANLWGRMNCGSWEQLPKSSWLTRLKMNEQSLVRKVILLPVLKASFHLLTRVCWERRNWLTKHVVVRHWWQQCTCTSPTLSYLPCVVKGFLKQEKELANFILGLSAEMSAGNWHGNGCMKYRALRCGCHFPGTGVDPLAAISQKLLGTCEVWMEQWVSATPRLVGDLTWHLVCSGQVYLEGHCALQQNHVSSLQV